MHFGFALFRYFPFGGLQRDMLAIARQCVARGHRVTVFCALWAGEQPDYVDVIQLPARGNFNHSRDNSFSQALQKLLKSHPVDRLVGFNKMPGLDIYYAADGCFAAKVYDERSRLYRYTPRARSYLRMEESVFSADSATKIMLISSTERQAYQHYYQTPDERMYLLPPGIRRDRVLPSGYETIRHAFRNQLNIAPEEKLVLFVGSGFKTKGLDRALLAVADLVNKRVACKLLVLGHGKTARFETLAKRLGIYEKIEFLGGVDNVSEYLWSADVLLHPAYRENTGTVLLEAMVAGLPVVTTGVCGYSGYVADAQMGAVVGPPFDQSVLNESLYQILQANGDVWRQRGQAFAQSADIFSLPEHAAELLEQL